ncbi:conserved hypothetical protein [Leishmania mexicana MHOM/GT/2001/U1103]|uniref:GRIP domain-containing protein n=1 Tax=Leishmania mexicana (strain MHOM/GT/2001/U1103) TaxID=929439 RepID=E9ANF3_LEIMU|nr:conserved hypothetical protein [Leishmania mexicana MHOM/GT/2001/U1103]CBZ24462.1 conserved hypothetical protein [Leishmania mexicana MHOM/GT/2001/U1103]
MDRFFKKSSSEAAQAKEEVELLQQKIKTMSEVATALETQLNDEKTKYTLLLTKTNTWKEKVKALTESDRSRIAELESQLAAYHVAGEANGGELTPEIRAAVQASLRGIMTKHAEEMDACKQQMAAAQVTLSTKETTITELMQELEAVKAVYLESQHRFAEEMHSVTDHHEKAMAQLQCQPESLQELEDLKSRFQEQQKEITSLENHSLQNAQIMSVLQQDLASSAEKNELLTQEVRTLQESLATLKQKQAIWKEKVMQMKAKDDETIKHLQSELALTRESSPEMNHSPPVAEPTAIGQPGTSATAATINPQSSSASRAPSSPPDEHLCQLSIQLEDEPITPRQFQEKLETWKHKVREMKIHDMRTIEALHTECDQLRHQLAASADEQAQAHETLRAELAAAQQERDNAAQQAQRHAEDAACVRQELEAKAAQFEQLEANVVTWKEKVKASKAQDAQRIASQEEELEQLRHQLAASADEQAQAHETLRAELAAAQQERDNAAQQAQRHAEDAACVRQELEAKAAQFEQLEANVVTWKEKVKASKAQDAQRIASQEEELEQLRHQLAASADEQAQAHETLRAELAAAQQERDNAAQQAQRHAEDAACVRQELEAKAAQFEQLEANVVTWKEKVKNAKLRDSERISSLTEARENWQREAVRVAEAVWLLCAGTMICGNVESPAEWSESLCEAVKDGQGALVCLSLKLGTEGTWAGIQWFKEQFTAYLDVRASAAEEAAERVEALEGEILRLKESEASLNARCENTEAHARDLEEDLKRASTQAEPEELEQLRHQLAASADEQAQAHETLRAELAAAQQERDNAAQQAQRHAEELEHLRHQLAASADEQAQAHETLRAELAAAQQERDNAAQQAQRHAEELEQLRHQLAASADEQAQAHETLRAELAAAQQERDNAAQQAQRHAEDAACVRQELEAKAAQFEQLEANVVTWKEKVKASKAQDAQRIASQEEELEQLRHQLAASADEQAQAHETLRAELAAAQQERDNAAQQAQRHAEELEQLRHQLAASADEQAQAHETLRAELAAAQQERDNAAQQAQRHAEELEHLRHQLAASADEQAQAHETLRAELAAAQQERDNAAQQAQRHAEELEQLRHQLAASADEQAQAHETLRAELAAAQQERDNAAQQAQRHAEELEQLRHQLAASADEQAQAHETLRAELAAAQQERDNAAQQAQRHAEDAACVRQELEAKAAQFEQLEANVVTWKEKVKNAKLRDSERISSLTEARENWQREAVRVAEAVWLLCAGTMICGNVESPAEWSESLCEAVKDGQGALVCLSLKLGTEGTWAGIQWFKEQFTAYLDVRASAAEEAAERVEALEGEILRLKESEASLNARCENTEAHARDLEEDLKRASTQAERVSELEQETSELRARCNLLRKELQRQREAMQRDRSQPHETANSEAAASPVTENASAVQSVLLAAAGCVSERDVATFVDSRGLPDGSLKLSKAAAEQLMKENAELKRENAHNNAVIAQYIRELEGYKANERVQLSIEYLRNIVQQYLCAAEDLRPKMIPAICTVLEFSSKQKEDVQTANPRCPRFH